MKIKICQGINLLENTKAFFGSIKTERKNTLYLKFQDYLTTHKIIQQNIKRKIMKELGGQGKNFGNPPNSFIPKNLTMYKFVEENENGSFSCETCDCSQMSSNELHMHIDLYHCAEKRDAFTKECFLKITNFGNRRKPIFHRLHLPALKRKKYMMKNWRVKLRKKC